MESTKEAKFQRRADLWFGAFVLAVDALFAAAVANVYFGNGWDPLAVREGVATAPGVLAFLGIFFGSLAFALWRIISSLKKES